MHGMVYKQFVSSGMRCGGAPGGRPRSRAVLSLFAMPALYTKIRGSAPQLARSPDGCLARTPQDSRVEIIAALDEAVAGLLLEFYKKTGGKKPERIIFYRDGVADGQFQHVLDQVAMSPPVPILPACVMLPPCDFPPHGSSCSLIVRRYGRLNRVQMNICILDAFSGAIM